MIYCWLLITISWIGYASLQYINTGGQIPNVIIDSLDPKLEYPSNSNFYHLTSSSNEVEGYQSQDANVVKKESALQNEGLQSVSDLLMKPKATSMEDFKSPNFSWMPNQDLEQTMQPQNTKDIHEIDTDALQYIAPVTSEQGSNSNDKRSFSPWKGKRTSPKYEQSNMWTWKRTSNIREPTMPKRVRFSPWGGKRSSQLIYKPGSKAAKIVFLNAYPDLARIMSNYKQIGLGGIRSKVSGPTIELFHPLRILTFRSEIGNMSKDNLKRFIESSRIFKTGHPYADVKLKREGKRKAKFSAWGGKRFPPIIGPIWSPSNQTLKDDSLNAIILIRDTKGIAEPRMAL